MKTKKIKWTLIAFLAAIFVSTFIGGTAITANTTKVYAGSTSVASLNGTTEYDTITDALANVSTGDNTITLLANTNEDIIVKQVEGVNIVIDGAGYEYSGTIYIHGGARFNGAETLTIKNVNFVTSEASHYSIDSNSTASAERYAHNVTIDNCTFTATGAAVKSAAAIRLRQAFNINVTKTTATGMHSLLQGYGISTVAIDNVTIKDGKNGIALGTSLNATVSNSTIDVDGYGIRADASETTTLTIDSCNVKAFIPVVLRKASTDYSVVVDGTNTMTATNLDNVWFASGTEEYEESGKLPTGVKVNLTVNDANLNNKGIYNYPVAELTHNSVVTSYYNIKEAIDAAVDGDVVTIYDNTATNKLTGYAFNKSITIKGAEINDNFYVEIPNMIEFQGTDLNVTFENIHFWYGPNDASTTDQQIKEKGIKGIKNLTYINCSFNYQVNLYGDNVTFIDCDFLQESRAWYNVCLHEVKNVLFEGCTFISRGGAIHMHNDGSHPSDVTINNPSFISYEPKDGVSAIEIVSREMNKGNIVKINFPTEDSRYDPPVIGFMPGDETSGRTEYDTLWDIDDFYGNNKIKVIINGVTYLEPAVAMIGDVRYTKLADAIKDAQGIYAGQTIVLVDDCEVTTDIVIDKEINIVNDTGATAYPYTITVTDAGAFTVNANFTLTGIKAIVNNGTITVTNATVNTVEIDNNTTGTITTDKASVIVNKLVNNGNANFKDSTIDVAVLDNDAPAYIEGNMVVTIDEATGSGYAIRAKDGTTLTNSYIKASDNTTLRMLGSLTVYGGLEVPYLEGAHSSKENAVGGTFTIADNSTVNATYGVEFSNNYVLNGGKIVLSGTNLWGFVFQDATYEINTAIEVVDAVMHFTKVNATVNSTITRTAATDYIWMTDSTVTVNGGAIETNAAIKIRTNETTTATLNVGSVSKAVTTSTIKAATVLNETGTIINLIGNVTVDAKFTGTGWVYAKSANFDANTKMIGAKVRFASGTNNIDGATITDGYFQVGIGAYKGVDANVDTVNGVTVNVYNNATIGANADTYAGWVGTGFYDTDAEKEAVMNGAKYELYIVDSIAEFGYLHVSNDGILAVIGNATTKAWHNNSDYTFYAGDFIINGGASFTGSDALALYTKVSCDNGTDNSGCLSILDGATYEAERHNGATAGLNFDVRKTGYVYVTNATLEIGDDAKVAENAGMNVLDSTFVVKGSLTNNGYINLDGTVKANVANAVWVDGQTKRIETDASGVTLVDSTINGSVRVRGNLTADGELTVGNLWVGTDPDNLVTATIAGDQINAYYVMFQHGTYTISADMVLEYAYLSYGATFTVTSDITTGGTTGILTYINGNVTLENGASITAKNGLCYNYDDAVLTIKEGASVATKAVYSNANHTGDVNVHGELKVDGTYANAGTITVYVTGTLTAKDITGNRKVVVDVSNYADSYNQTKIIDLDATTLEGSVEIINNNSQVALVYGDDGDVTLANGVARIGGIYYATLAKAISVVKDGETIYLCDTIDENVTIKQVAGLSFTIDGQNNTYTGTITINGNNNINGLETLTIKNINFVADSDYQYFINASSKNNTAHNVTVDNCTFTNDGGYDVVVGVRLRTTKNITIANCKAYDMWYLVYNVSGGHNLTIDNCVVDNCSYCINVNGSYNVLIEDTIITNSQFFDIRTEADNETTMTIRNCKVSTTNTVAPIWIMNFIQDYTIVLEGNTFTTSASTWIDDADTVVNDSTKTLKVVMGAGNTINGVAMDETNSAITFEAKIGNVYYSRIETAFAEAVKGDTIDILCDVTLTETIEIADADVLKDLTINGNGHTVTLNTPGAAGFRFGAVGTARSENVTINDLTITGNAKYGIWVSDGGSTTLNNVTIDGTYEYPYGGLILYGTQGATITDSSIVSMFTNGGDDFKVNIVNSEIDVLFANASQSAADKAKVFIDDASIIGELWIGGNNSTPVDTASLERVGLDKAFSEFTEANFEVKVGVAGGYQIYYATFEDAVEAVKDGETITLVQDIDLDESFKFNKEGTYAIDGNGYAFTQSANYADKQNGFFMLGDSTYDDTAIATRNYTIKNATFKGIDRYSVIRAQGVALTMDGCTVVNSNNYDGLALIRLDNTDANIINSKFVDNVALIGIAHNFNSTSNSKFTVDECYFENNTFNKIAGIYYVRGAYAKITKSEFVNNTVNCNVNGAVIYLGFQENCEVTGCLFKGNDVIDASTSTRVAGAIFFGYDAEITGNAFDGNTATNANGDALGQQVCTSTYYTDIDLSDNYFNNPVDSNDTTGERPVEGEHFYVQHKDMGHTWAIQYYYTEYTLDADGNVVLSGRKQHPYAKFQCGAYNVGSSGTDGVDYRENFNLELEKVYAEQSVVIKIYDAQGNLLGTSTLRESDRDDATITYYPYTGTLTVNVVVAGERLAGSWDTVWATKLTVNNLPAYYEVYADGYLADTWGDEQSEKPFIDEKEKGDYILLDGVEGKEVVRVTETGAVTLYFAADYTNGTNGAIAKAIDDTGANDTVIIYTAGHFTLPAFANKDITIEGANHKDHYVFFDITDSVAINGSNVIFDNISFDYDPCVEYKGLTGAKTITYNYCDFYHQVSLYGEEVTFNNCIFSQDSATYYNLITYQAKKVVVYKTTFHSSGRSVLVYNDKTTATGTELIVTDSSFTTQKTVAGVAAIEIDSSEIWNEDGVQVTVSEIHLFGFDVNANAIGGGLWNNKNGIEGVNNDITVTVDGTVVLEPIHNVQGRYDIVNGLLTYSNIQSAIDDNSTAILLLVDINGKYIPNTVEVNKDVAINLNGKTVTANFTVFDVTAKLTIRNGSVNATNGAAVQVTSGKATITNGTYTSNTNAIVANGGELEIIDGTIGAIYNDGATTVITGGTIDSIYANAGSVTIKEVVKYKESKDEPKVKGNVEAANGTIAISAGFYIEDVAEFVIGGYRQETSSLTGYTYEVNYRPFEAFHLTLGSNIAIDYHVYLTAEEAVTDGSTYMTFDIKNGVYETKYQYNFVKEDKPGVNHYLFELDHINPALMGDTIYATLYIGGQAVSSNEYSIREYCDDAIADVDNSGYTGDKKEAYMTLLADLLDYGAAAQLYTGYRTNNLANKGFAVTGSTYVAPNRDEAEAVTPEKGFGVTPKSVQVVYGDANTIRFNFIVENATGNKATDLAGKYAMVNRKGIITILGKAEDLCVWDEDNQRYYMETQDILATELDFVFAAGIFSEFSVDALNDGAWITYSIESAVTRRGNNGSKEGTLLAELWCYGESSKAFAKAQNN